MITPPEEGGPLVTSTGNEVFRIHHSKYSALIQIGGAGCLIRGHSAAVAGWPFIGASMPPAIGAAGSSVTRKVSGSVIAGSSAGTGDWASTRPALANRAVSDPRSPLFMIYS